MEPPPSSTALAALFDLLPVGVVLLDANGVVRAFNAHEERQAGRHRERVVGRDFFEEIAPCLNVRELAESFRAGVRAGDLDERVDTSFPFPFAEEPREVIVRLRSFIADDEPHGLVTIEDVAHRRALDGVRESLASALQHDLANSLMVINGVLQLVGDERLQGGGRRAALDDGLAASRALSRTLRGLFDLTRLETGMLVIRPRVTDVAELLRGVRTATDPETTIVIMAEGEPAVASIDRDLVLRSVENLVDNAVRRSLRDPRVTLQLIGESDRVVIDVIDNGAPIPEERHEAIFDKYGRVSGVAGLRGANHGLGLTFARLVARAHGGDLSIHLGPRGTGAIFRLALPTQTQPPHSPRSTTRAGNDSTPPSTSKPR